MSDVLVTGGLGFIGSHLVERLFAEGHRVRVYDNCDDTLYDGLVKMDRADRYAREYPNQYQPWYADICSDHYLERLFDEEGYRPDVIFHLAAIAGVRPSLQNPGKYADVNVGGTTRMLDWAAKINCPKFIYASSSSVYGELTPPFWESLPLDKIISPYALSKRQGELACDYYSREYGLSIASLRFFTVYGPRQRPDMFIRAAMEKILEGETITLYGDGSTYRDYTYVDDIVDGLMQLLGTETPAGNHIYNLGRGLPTTLLELMEHLENALGKKAKVEHIETQKGDVTATLAYNDKAKDAFGYDPKTSVAEGVPKMTQWVLENR